MVNVVDLDMTVRDEKALVDAIDLNHDGKISYAEFINFMTFSDARLRAVCRALQKKMKALCRNEDDMRRVFGQLATADHRSLSTAKFKELVANTLGLVLQPGEMGSLLAMLDTDGNGQVNYDEFVRFVRNHGVPAGQSVAGGAQHPDLWGRGRRGGRLCRR